MMALDDFLTGICERLPGEVSIYEKKGSCISSSSNCDYCKPINNVKLCHKTTKILLGSYAATV